MPNRLKERNLCHLQAQVSITSAYAAAMRGNHLAALTHLHDARRAMQRRDVWRAVATMEGAR